MPQRRTVLRASPAALLWLAGCGGRRGESTSTVESTPEEATEPASGPYWYTHPQPTGNRFVSGSADLRDSEPVRFAVDARPEWLVAHPAPRGSYWTVSTAAGTATRFQVTGGRVADEMRLHHQSPERPPVVASGGAAPTVLDHPSSMSRNGGQIVASGPAGTHRLYVAANGDLVVDGDERHRLPVEAPTDARPAAVGDGRYVVYGDVTDRYRHGALGDQLEPSSLVVVDPTDSRIVARTELDAPLVFEGLQPLVADLDGDGEPEIVTTIADAERGARIAVYSVAGERIATGPVDGPGWRHQLAVGPFGPDGSTELAAVLKPHVTHRLEYYRLEDGDLSVRATLDGVSSHVYGSRTLGGALAADLDGDGRVELLVPTTDRRRLVAVARTSDGARSRWEWDLETSLTSNLTGVGLDGGGLAVGAATATDVFVWSA
ncbi:hypothetical protein [Halobellus clavatus]|uniref:Repeat domain-containing protein n=1 Tax=Halobellus clavatus TaxID=660517 RepID=A0A1H3JK85_9EURY|nr:hypothetical protein [Halobellus clavatus]SDY40332.1 hypothetical protein SAMN04487946_11424 [Halobellus clavatus]